MTVPTFQELMLPVLKLVAECGELGIKETEKKLADQLELSETERNETIPSRRQTTLYNRVSWAINDLYAAGLLKRPRTGCYVITEEGKKVLQSEPELIDRKFLAQYPSFIETRSRKRKTSDPDEQTTTSETPDEQIETAYEELIAGLKHELLKRILEMTPEFFERLVLDLLVAMGYGGASQEQGEHLGKSGDGGIDGMINQDKLGVDVVYVQAKRYAEGNPVGIKEVRDFVGSLSGKTTNKGILFTTSDFPNDAQSYLDKVNGRVILVNGEKLVSLMIEHNIGVSVSHKIEFKHIDEGFFSD